MRSSFGEKGGPSCYCSQVEKHLAVKVPEVVEAELKVPLLLPASDDGSGGSHHLIDIDFDY